MGNFFTSWITTTASTTVPAIDYSNWTVKYDTTTDNSLPYNGPGSFITYNPPVKMRNKKSTAESLKKRKLSKRDITWLGKISAGKDISKMPQTVFTKLMAKGLIDIGVTKEGKKERVLETIKHI